jgi:hypothetical protein
VDEFTRVGLHDRIVNIREAEPSKGLRFSCNYALIPRFW